MKKIGKIGEANRKAREMIADQCEALGLDFCEIRLPGCMGTFGIAPAHKHKRVWYKGNPELLADYNEWVAACQACHDKIEVDKELTKVWFERLRPV